MDALQEAMGEALLNAPLEAFANLIVGKLTDQGITLSKREREEIVTQLRSGTDEVLRFRKWQLWGDKHLSVEVTAAEIALIHERFTKFLEDQLPRLIASTADDLSAHVLETLHRTWASQLEQEKWDLQGFQRRLHERWGRGIDRLRMSLVITREFGAGVNTALRKAKDHSQPALVETLSRLHARSCQVTDEILCLLSAGLSDGAMARWRTLHEIAVVAYFIKEHGENLAIRYVDHQAVEGYRAAVDYKACYERLGYEPLSEAEFDKARQAFEDVVKRYGDTFKTQYGWAAKALDIKRPSFGDIEQAAGIDHFRAHYRLASHNVHANPKGVFYKLGLIGEADILLTGPSNAGLADPGYSAARSLLQVSTALGSLKPTLDSIVSLKILAKLVNEVDEAFAEAHEKLESASDNY